MAITTLFLAGIEISPRMYRGLVSDLFGEGIRNIAAGEFQVIPRALGANMTVTVRKGTGSDAVAYIVGDDVAGQGTYRVASDSDFLDLGIAAAPASGSRTDLVVLEVVDSQVVGGSTNLSRFRVLTGVSALTTEKSAIPLARITVTAGTTSIQASNITDLRAAQTGGGAAVRTAAQPLTTAQIAALSGMRVGDLVTNTDTGRVQSWSGSAWRGVGATVTGKTSLTVTIPANSATWYPMEFYVGLGFTEASFAMTGGSIAFKFRADVTADPGQAIVQGVGSSSAYLLDQPQSATQAVTVGVNGGAARNLRLDADGFVRFEIQYNNGTGVSTTTYPVSWRAR